MILFGANMIERWPSHMYVMWCGLQSVANTISRYFPHVGRLKKKNKFIFGWNPTIATKRHCVVIQFFSLFLFLNFHRYFHLNTSTIEQLISHTSKHRAAIVTVTETELEDERESKQQQIEQYINNFAKNEKLFIKEYNIPTHLRADNFHLFIKCGLLCCATMRCGCGRVWGI